MAPAPVAAQVEPVGADYGPASVCVAGYVLAVRGDEAVLRVAYGRLILRSHALNAFEVSPEAAAPDDRRFTVSTLVVPGLGAVRRYDYPTQNGYRPGIPGEMVGYTQARHTEYVLPAIGDALPVRLVSETFTGGGGDKAMLRRFSARTPASRCDPLRSDPTGWWTREVEQWSPARTRGPAFICLQGLGFPILGAEYATRTWAAGSGGASYGRITGLGYQVAIFGARIPQAQGKPGGNLLAMGYRIEPNETGATLWPPAGYPRDANDNGLVYIRATGLDDAALAAILGRLEYIGPHDRRCRT